MSWVQASSVEWIVPFMLGSVFFLWSDRGPSIAVMIGMVFLAFFLGFMPSRGIVRRGVYVLAVPALPILPYMGLAASSHMSLNGGSDGFTELFVHGSITPSGVWHIYSQFLVLTAVATIVYAGVLLIKRSLTHRSKV